jgi:GntR family transcriptional repressor for pyruvate dehydrogenase complex
MMKSPPEPAPMGGLERRAGQVKVERRKLSTLVADLITDTILTDGLRPGAKLPSEKEMLTTLGVGRATLREALRLLEAEGLISVRTGPQGGPVVEHPDVGRLTRMLLLLLITSGANLRQVYETRFALDPAVARLAAANASPEHIEQLRASLARMEANIEVESEFLVENRRFHRAIAEAADNLVMLAFSLSILDIIDGSAVGIRYSVKARRTVVEMHRTMTEAIASGDAEASAAAALEHVEIALSYYQRRFPKALEEPIRASSLTREHH